MDTIVLARISLLVAALSAAGSCIMQLPSYPTCYFSGNGRVVEWTDDGRTRLFVIQAGELRLQETFSGHRLSGDGTQGTSVTWPSEIPVSRLNVFGQSSDGDVRLVIRDHSKDGSGAYYLKSSGKFHRVPIDLSPDLEGIIELRDRIGFLYRDQIVWESGSGRVTRRFSPPPGEPGPLYISHKSRSFCVTSDQKAIIFGFDGKKTRSWTLPGKPIFVGFSDKLSMYYCVDTGGNVWPSDGRRHASQSGTILRGGVTDDLTWGIGRDFGNKDVVFALTAPTRPK